MQSSSIHFIQVLSVLTHINKRVKAQQSVKLPLGGLLEQYLSLETPQIVKNINIIYLEMAFERSLPQVLNSNASCSFGGNTRDM
jgi:hypothetical protein